MGHNLCLKHHLSFIYPKIHLRPSFIFSTKPSLIPLARSDFSFSDLQKHLLSASPIIFSYLGFATSLISMAIWVLFLCHVSSAGLETFWEHRSCIISLHVFLHCLAHGEYSKHIKMNEWSRGPLHVPPQDAMYKSGPWSRISNRYMFSEGYGLSGWEDTSRLTKVIQHADMQMYSAGTSPMIQNGCLI